MSSVIDYKLHEKSMLELTPLSEAIGAEVRGANLATMLDNDTFDFIYKAWLDYGLLLFRNQLITAADQVAFSRRFGELDVTPPQENGQKSVSEFPEILVVSNVVENGESIGSLGSGELVWHMDMTYVDFPPKGISLRTVEVPENEGHTGFLNLYKAYEEMSDELRTRIEDLELKHDATHNSAGYLRAGLDDEFIDVAVSPGAIHPLVFNHPESGRKALFLGRRPYAYIMGLSVEDSETLLDELWAWVNQPRFYWYHTWHKGDLLLWDNRCVAHRREAFSSTSRRTLHRTQIRQDRVQE